jgi:hypothetical protein
MLLAGFEPIFPASGQLQTHILDCMTIGIDILCVVIKNNISLTVPHWLWRD